MRVLKAPREPTVIKARKRTPPARRYARLLVSEIRLYHETAVIDGRRDRDLATRLGGEIARARVMYEQRVPPQRPRRAPIISTTSWCRRWRTAMPASWKLKLEVKVRS